MGDRALASELENRDIHDRRVLEAIAHLTRSHFVPEDVRGQSTGDFPLPIGWGQTISQPYIVAYMTQALGLKGNERVLEIGTGSGYQAAVLAQLCAEVCSVEIVPQLAERARQALAGFSNVHLRQGDGAEGWPDKAPFDGILLTAAPEVIPPALLRQLRPGAHLIAPVGRDGAPQELVDVVDGRRRALLPVRFVPMTFHPSGPFGPAPG